MEKIPKKVVIKNSHKKVNSTLSNQSFEILNEWLVNNLQNPYPSIQVKKDLSKSAKISISSVDKWFQNQRTQMRKIRTRTVVRPALKNKI